LNTYHYNARVDDATPTRSVKTWTCFVISYAQVGCKKFHDVNDMFLKDYACKQFSWSLAIFM